jgi:hypothetical protein
MDRVMTRKAQEESRKKRNLERQLAREARKGSENPPPRR